MNLAWDNSNALDYIREILNLNYKIISILTAEQIYLLSNLESIKYYNKLLGNKIEDSIINKIDISNCVNILEDLIQNDNKILNIHLEVLKNPNKTQESKYKSLLRILREIKISEFDFLINEDNLNCAYLIPINNIESKSIEEFKGDTYWFSLERNEQIGNL